MDLLPESVTVNVNYVSYPFTRSITCFRCGEIGHYRSECHTYKTSMCPNHMRCTQGNCPFAHDESELRQPWMPKCVRVVKFGGRVQVLGCGNAGHTFRMCPYQSVGTSHTESPSNFSV